MGTCREHSSRGQAEPLSRRVIRTYRQPLYQFQLSAGQARGYGTGSSAIATHLSIIGFTSREECVKGVVTGDEETDEVDEELARDVEENKEKVDSNKTQESIHLGDRGLSLKLVEDGVLGQLLWMLPMVSFAGNSSGCNARQGNAPPCRAELCCAGRGPGSWPSLLSCF